MSLLFDLDETAELLNVSPSTVAKLARKGDLRSVHIGRRHLVPRSSIVDYIDALSVTATQGSAGE